MFKSLFTGVLFVVISFFGNSQYYTKAQINTINANKTANEGDLYLDTISGNYYIGLTNGRVSQMNTDSAVINGIIDQELDDSIKGTIFPIWAEESGALNTNAFEWAYGNGDDAAANFGIVVPINCELFAVGLTLLDGSGEVEVYKNGIGTGATTGTGGVGATLNKLTTPILFYEGDNLNFRTLATSGANNGGKVVAWLRIKSKIPTYDRLNGAGIPSSLLGNDDDEYLNVTTGDLYIKEAGTWILKINIKGPSGAISNRSVIQVTNTASGNVNANAGATGTLFTWINTSAATHQTNDASAFVVANDGVTVSTAGLYKLTVFQYQENVTGERVNAAVRFTINAVVQDGFGANTYQRRLSGHDESTASFSKVFNLVGGQKVGINNIALGNGGNVVCPAGTLVFIIEQL